MRRAGQPAAGIARAAFAGGLLLAVALACSQKADFSRIDAAGDRLSALVGAATQALADSDAPTLTRCRGDLVSLRQETRALTLPKPTAELRDTLVVAMDLLVDGLDATAAGVASRSAGEQSADLVHGRELLVEATAHLEFGQARLEKALGSLNHYQELRSRLEGRP